MSRWLLAATIAAICLFLIFGCAASGTRVSEFSAGVEGGRPLLGGGQLTIKQGCQLSQWGAHEGCFIYIGENCFYASPACTSEVVQ